jgi:hypothetical protein
MSGAFVDRSVPSALVTQRNTAQITIKVMPVAG